MTRMEQKEEDKIIRENPHLKMYLDEIQNKMHPPIFYSKLPRDLKDEKYPNIIYPTKGAVFIHIYRTKDMIGNEYHAIEPTLNEKETVKRDQILDLMYEKAPFWKTVRSDEELKEGIRSLMDQLTIIDERSAGVTKLTHGKVRLTSLEKKSIEYDITKNIIGGGPLEPFMRDPYLEDIHIITGENVHLIHKIFEMIKTNIFIDKAWANTFSQEFSEKIGSPVSEGQPIADGTLPDLSLIHI